jgi:starvation-inducible DNA-binding protein
MNGSSELYTTRPYATLISISPQSRVQLIDILNQTLATTVDLKTQVKHAKWNVKPTNLYDLYQLFDEIATELDVFIDLLAERVITLGGLAMGTARTAVRQSILPEYPLHITESKDHIASVAERLAIFASLLWENIDCTSVLGDADTAYLYAEVSSKTDKRLWLLDTLLVNRLGYN